MHSHFKVNVCYFFVIFNHTFLDWSIKMLRMMTWITLLIFLYTFLHVLLYVLILTQGKNIVIVYEILIV